MQGPRCQSDINSTNINVQTDVGTCTVCHHVFKLSEQILSIHLHPLKLEHTVAGVTYRHDWSGHTIVANAWHLPSFLCTLLFALPWTLATVAMFNLAGIMTNGMSSKHFISLMFVCAACSAWVKLLFLAFGKVEVHSYAIEGSIFTGIGIFGFKRHFYWQEIDAIEEDIARDKMQLMGAATQRKIMLLGKKILAFGSFLKAEKYFYLLQAMRQLKSASCNLFPLGV